MLVRICDICGEKLDPDNLIQLDGGTIRSKTECNDNHERSFFERDICIECARSYNLVQMFNLLENLNV